MPKIEKSYPLETYRREPQGRRILLKIKDGAKRYHNFRHFRQFISL